MKIAVLIDTWFPFIGGGQINALEISKCIANKGVHMEIITRNTGIERIRYPKNITIVKLGKKSTPENNLAKLMFLITSFFYIYKKDYDLIHAHAFFPGIIARILMITKGIPAIFTVHGTSLGTKLNSLASRLVEGFILTKILYSAQITVSRDFMKIKNVNKKIYYIPNGIDKFYLTSPKVKRKNQILCVARLHSQKNLINLIQAFRTVINDYPDYKLVIAGKGPQREALKGLIKDLKLKNSAHLIGEADKTQLKNFYLSSKLFVLTSTYEGQPLSLLEALASRLPIVASNVGDIPFIINDSINGYLIDDPTNSEEISHIIKKALKNKDLSKLADKGYNTVKNNFTWNIAAQKTYKVYEKVAKIAN